VLEALAVEGSRALVSAMVTDEWESVRTGWTQLLGQSRATRAAGIDERLERSRTALIGLSGLELEQALARETAAWSVRLADLLEDDPAIADRLRQLVEQMQALRSARVSSMVVGNTIRGGRVQQAVQGSGVQVNTFSPQGRDLDH
jgi:hypothetical protein